MPYSAEIKVQASNQAASANNITFNAVPSLTFYLQGFVVSGLGATGSITIAITISGSASSGTPTWNYVVPAGVTTAAPTLQQTFTGSGIPASAPNSALTLNVPSFGAGNTTVSVVAWGRYV